MGKKAKTKRTHLESGLSTKKLRDLLADIFQKCVYAPNNCSEKELLQNHCEIRAALNPLEKAQKCRVQTLDPRESGFDKFQHWLKEKGVHTDSAEINSIPNMEKEFGISTTENINAGSVFLRVPKSAMICSDMIEECSGNALIAEDPLLAGMPNVALAFYLVFELYNDFSQWKPYIGILPRSFNNVLYFSEHDFHLLRGSPSLKEACNIWRSIVRQYTYLHMLLLKHSEPKIVKFAENFTFADYRWAVSVVMTRENAIPSKKNATKNVIALIPLLDMCNHSNTSPSVDYDDSHEACVCYASKDYTAGEEVRIFYGTRSNSDFVLHNGFYFTENVHDVYRIRLGLGKSDVLRQIRIDALTRFQLPETLDHAVYNLPKCPIDEKLALYSYIFCATADELESVRGKSHDYFNGGYKQGNAIFTDETKVKARIFLKNRLKILLSAFPDSVQIDDDLLASDDISQISRIIIQLRRKEKLMLQNAIAFLTHEV